MKIDYKKYPSKISEYKGITFRSKLEKKWAMMFDLLNWNWQYEPIRIGNYTPDFIIKIDDSLYLVEVKPIMNRDKIIQERLRIACEKTKYRGCILLFGNIFLSDEIFYGEFSLPSAALKKIKFINFCDEDNINISDYYTTVDLVLKTTKIGLIYFNGITDNNFDNCNIGWSLKNYIKNNRQVYVINHFMLDYSYPLPEDNIILKWWAELNNKL
jgi:hypothetical protein